MSLEQELWAAGHEVVVGIDEVGRGAWAGPLMVGAAILPRDRRVNGVRDSKMLTEAERELLFDRIAGWCVGVGRRAARRRRSATSWAWPRRSGWPPAGRSTALGVDARRGRGRRQLELRGTARRRTSRRG